MTAQQTVQKKSFSIKTLSMNKIKLWGGIAGGLLIVLLIFNAVISKPQGTQFYGICKTFIELNMPYPTTLNIVQVQQYTYSVQIYYNHIDPFGSVRSEMMECGFDVVDGQTQLVSILKDRKPIETEKVQKFNATMGAVVAGKPDLTLPRRLKGSIEALKSKNFKTH